MLNLRTIEGLDVKFVKDKQEIISKLAAEGLIIQKDNHIIPTYEGMMVLDQVILQLL